MGRWTGKAARVTCKRMHPIRFIDQGAVWFLLSFSIREQQTSIDHHHVMGHQIKWPPRNPPVKFRCSTKALWLDEEVKEDETGIITYVHKKHIWNLCYWPNSRMCLFFSSSSSAATTYLMVLLLGPVTSIYRMVMLIAAVKLSVEHVD